MVTDLARTDHQQLVGADTLAYLGLDPRKPEVRALVLLCQRYGLDPLLGHADIIPAKGGNKAYITRDGMLEIAHRSGQLDGIVVDDQHETEHGGHSATVSVWRKDMTHPFTYKGGCGHQESQTRQGNGPEMALARAERRALRRAFAIPAYDDGDEPYEETGEIQPPQADSLMLAKQQLLADLNQAQQADPEWIAALRDWWKRNYNTIPPVTSPDFNQQHIAIIRDKMTSRQPAIQSIEPTPADVIDEQPETVDEPSYRYDPADNSGEPFE